jgi:ubiquinone/menaquinone biosynthesis C-methylase UbiE
MSDKDKNFTGSIPDIYDEFLVPLIFESYARDMAQRVAEVSPLAVLETAAGSGVVTRALAPLLTSAARYVVTDLNPPMLERAARQQPADVRIEWQQADAMALPFEDEVFDVVCCQFGMMFLPDKTTGYSEALRILRDGGRFIFNVWDKIEDNEFAQSVTATATRFFPMTRLFSCSGPHMVFMM